MLIFQQRQWAFVDCAQQHFGQQNYGQQNFGLAVPRPVCKKLKQLGKFRIDFTEILHYIYIIIIFHCNYFLTKLLLFSNPATPTLNSKVNDKVVVSRSCAYEDINSPPDQCMRTTTPSYIKTEFCETCGHDGKI